MVFKHLPTPSTWVAIGQPCALDGLHQPASPEICEQRRSVIEAVERGDRSFASLSINDYQMWAGLDWKLPHGTVGAAQRICNKFAEEVIHELVPALEKRMQLPRRNGSSHKVDKDAVSELGDVLWCLSALATVDGVDLQRALAHYLLDETGSASLVYDLKSIDKLFKGGFKPRLTRTTCNNEDDDHHELSPGRCLISLCSTLYFRTATKLEDAVHLDNKLPPPASWSQDLEAAGQTYAQTILFLAYYAHRWAGSNFTAVVRTNIQKVNLRVARKHIDKSDGKRAHDEL